MSEVRAVYSEGFAIIEDQSGTFIYTKDDRIIPLDEQRSAKNTDEYDAPHERRSILT